MKRTTGTMCQIQLFTSSHLILTQISIWLYDTTNISVYNVNDYVYVVNDSYYVTVYIKNIFTVKKYMLSTTPY